MTVEQFADSFAQYLRKAVGNPQQLSTRAFLRVLDTDTGKAVLARRLKPILSVFADESGNLNPSELHDIAKAALGGERFNLLDIISLSSDDIEAFFAACQG